MTDNCQYSFNKLSINIENKFQLRVECVCVDFFFILVAYNFMLLWNFVFKLKATQKKLDKIIDVIIIHLNNNYKHDNDGWH